MTTVHDAFVAEMNSGQPIVDNANDRMWGPNGQHDDQPDRPDGACGFCGGVGTVEDGDRLCQVCRGAGGWQQPDGLIVECPRGCMTRDDDTCTDCGRELSRPGRCFDCQVEDSYVGGLAPRFGAQP